MVDKIILELPADTVGGDILVSTETRERAEQAAAQAEATVSGMIVGGTVDGDNLVLTKAGGGTVVAGDVRGPQGNDGSNVLPTDTAIAQAINTSGSETQTQLNATIAEEVETQVPGVMAADPTIAAAAAAAVDAVPAVARKLDRADAPIFLTPPALSIATGEPGLSLMSSISTQIPVWSFSGTTAGQSIAGLVTGLPRDCAAVRVEITVTTTSGTTSDTFDDVHRAHLSQMTPDASFTDRYILGAPIRTPLPATQFRSRTIVLEPFYEVDPALPLWVRVQREPTDSNDTFAVPTGIAMVRVIPLDAPAPAAEVQEPDAYNAWPMLQAVGDELVCAYSVGNAHSSAQPGRGVYAKTSTDGGETWGTEAHIATTEGYGTSAMGKGLAASGQMLLWLRRATSGGERLFDVVRRTVDGSSWEVIVSPPQTGVSHIGDIIAVPGVGLMCLWNSSQTDTADNAWGILVNGNGNGTGWARTTIESGLPRGEWPTEMAPVYLGDGVILAIGRSELVNGDGSDTARAEFMLVSTDYGVTWTKTLTNITDVLLSTAGLIYDPATDLLTVYYYHRGRGQLKRRVADRATVLADPRRWPAPEVVATGSTANNDAGNANVTVLNGKHYVSFYSGDSSNTGIYVIALDAPA